MANQIDTQKAVGLTLISLLLIIYMYFFAPKPPKQVQNQPPTTTTVLPQAQYIPPTDKPCIPPSTATQANKKKETKEYILENNMMQVTISTHGGKIKKVWLKQYKTYLKDPLVLIDNQSSHMELKISTPIQNINTNQHFFHVANQGVVEVDKEGTQTLTLELPLSPQAILKYTYTLKKNDYTLGYVVKMTGQDKHHTQKAQFFWKNKVKRIEKNIEESKTKTTINYSLQDDSFNDLGISATENKTRNVHNLHWVNTKQKFFSAAILAQNGFSKAKLTTIPQSDDTFLKTTDIVLDLSTQDLSTQGEKLQFYFGPNDYKIMKKVAKGFERNVYLGWPVIKWFNQLVIMPIFDFLAQFITNYGILIIVLVLIIKIILLPLSYKSYISMSKMKSLKPALDDIKKRHEGNMQQIQLEQMQLYREMGINPLSGCIPVLLQIPILFALFNFFPNTIAFRQEGFLWANDLSTYDSICTLPFTIPFYGDHVSLFTILMTGSTILYTWSNNQVSTAQGPMKMVSYMMPIMFMFVLNSFPASLSFYYFVANMITFLQQSLIKKSVDEKKIRQKLEINKRMYRSNPKKKSNFKQMLEKAMKEAAERKKNKK